MDPYYYYHQQQPPPPMYQGQEYHDTQFSLPTSKSVEYYCNIIGHGAKTMSSSELSQMLDALQQELQNINNQQQKKTDLSDIVSVLSFVNSSTLVSIAQHKFFALLQPALIQLLGQWIDASYLNERDVFMFRSLIKITRVLSKNATKTNINPSWLIEPSFLKIIVSCLTSIARSDELLQNKNQRELKNFIRLFDLYTRYQKQSNEEDPANNDKLVQLVEPVVLCLTSNHYLRSFEEIRTDTKSMKTKKRFFLTKCPLFLASYNGSRLEQIMDDLLSTILPQYITLLDKLSPSISQWNHSVMRVVNGVLIIVNQGTTNTKMIATHLSFIDHVLNLVNTPTLYNNLQAKLSNVETVLMTSAVSFLSNVVSEPIILSHIKQKKMTPSFLRLTSAQHEPLAYDVYTLLAYTASEEDIKAMRNAGVLLSTVTKSLRNIITYKPDNLTQIEQLLETLKGLVQHDQMKEEVIKQNILPFLLECTNKLSQQPLILLLETLWSLTFSPQAAPKLRDNSQFLSKIQTLSTSTSDEAMKKAADGLIWKLIREPAFLEKVAKQDAEAVVQETKVIIGADGKEQIVTTTKAGAASGERTFQYDMMISYCHADKELVHKVFKFLEAEGFTIWIDLNQMFGPAMNAMAEAVENSEFVLICMSDSYKQSTYCQAEAEYAFGCKRRLLPLIVRPGYKADGWLGFMMGSRIYIDFGFFDFNTACQKMLNEISLQRKRPLPSKVGQAAQPVKTAVIVPEKPDGALPNAYTKRQTTGQFKQKSIDHWTESDVLDFLFHHRLTEIMPLCERMDGQALLQLYKMCIASNHQTYTLLDAELKVTQKEMLPIGIYTRFLSVMERLTLPPQLPSMTMFPMRLPPEPPPPPPSMMIRPAPPPMMIRPAPRPIMIRPPSPPMMMRPRSPLMTIRPPSPPMMIPPPSPSIMIRPAPPPRTIRPLSPPPMTMLPSRPQIPAQKIAHQPLMYVPVYAKNLPFDILVNSNASTSKILQMVERLASQVKAMPPEQRRRSIYI